MPLDRVGAHEYSAPHRHTRADRTLPSEGEDDVDTRATRRGVPAVALWGGFGALAWAALTVLTGGGSAQADEQPNGP
ncbi:hypothetical protein XS42_004591, partial [Salmonella enterica subsp. enterica]|nr:hypothetical protein [Salmonella enterica subsp. enterica]